MSDQKDQSNNSDLPAAIAALSVEDRQDLDNDIKSKLQDLCGDHEDFLNTLSPNVKQRVVYLKKIQSEHDELESKYFEERAALEAKYQQLYEPLYVQRYEVVNGVVEVEGVTPESTTDEDTNKSAGKGVPHFWLTAMKNNGIISDEITERDEAALKYLKDIKWSRLEDFKGYKLEFIFDPNPYFKNSVLTKTYRMYNEDEHVLEKATGTKIEWFPESNLTRKVLKKKPKGSKDSQPVTRIEDCASFFNFFYPPEVPEDVDEIDEETVELLQSQMEQDYNVGSTIKTKIIPHAVAWFTGEAASDNEEETDVDDEDEEDEEEDDTEEGEENEETDK